MEFKEAKKIYFRFLKENGIYANAIEKHCATTKGVRRDISFALKQTAQPLFWLSSCSSFCYWETTPETSLFWWGMSLLWQHECIKNNIYFGVENQVLINDFSAKYGELTNKYLTAFGNKIAYMPVDSSVLDGKIKEIYNKLFELNKKYYKRNNVIINGL